MSSLVLRVRRNGRLLGSWALDGTPLEFSVVDGESAAEVASFQIAGAAGGQRRPITGETPERPHPAKIDGDDFTMPLPEPAAALKNPFSDKEETLIRPAPAPDDPRPANVRAAPRPAEVWVRRKGEWCSAGTLMPRQRATLYGGWVKHASDGRIVVSPGTRLCGSASLPDGRTVDMRPGQDALALPAGTSILLRHGEHGLYVRSDAVPVVAKAVVPDSGPVAYARPARTTRSAAAPLRA